MISTMMNYMYSDGLWEHQKLTNHIIIRCRQMHASSQCTVWLTAD